MNVKINYANNPVWKEVTIKSKVPAKLEKLQLLSENLWWVWNNEATDLFKEIDNTVWNDCGRNPVLFLEKVSIERLEEVEENAYMTKKIEDVYAKFEAYVKVKPDHTRPSVAYFSM
jgi:starch phosphorylase